MNSIEETLDQIRKYTLIGVKNVLTVEEAAIYTGHSEDWIRRRARAGKIPHHRPDGCADYYFDKHAIESWMRGEPGEAERKAAYNACGFKTYGCHPVRSKPGRPPGRKS